LQLASSPPLLPAEKGERKNMDGKPIEYPITNPEKFGVFYFKLLKE
jgi:hypothetical protein